MPTERMPKIISRLLTKALPVDGSTMAINLIMP